MKFIVEIKELEPDEVFIDLAIQDHKGMTAKEDAIAAQVFMELHQYLNFIQCIGQLSKAKDEARRPTP